jgi:ABC-2 type transport system permease protein
VIDALGNKPSSDLAGELRKVAAFVRRDLLVAWSYRLGFFSDAVVLVAQALLFSYVSRLVDPETLPVYGGTRASYMSFVTIGIALTAFLQVGLGRMVTAIRAEQYMGTLEPLLVTPTRPTTLQLGSVAYDVLYVPIRTGLFLLVASATLGVHLHAPGFAPAAVVILAFIPFVWGIGAASAAAVLTFRRGSGLFGVAAFGLTFASGAYFPLDVLPNWVESIARANPIAIAIEASRRALLAGDGWAEILPSIAVLVGASAIALATGLAAFRGALRRERRLGTIGLY